MENSVLDRVLYFATLIGAAHLYCGFAVLQSPPALYITALSGLHTAVEKYALTSETAGWGLIAIGAAALIATIFGLPNWARFILLAPQQGLILVQAASIFATLVDGQYPDGYTPGGDPVLFISSDQVIWLLAISGHTFETFRLIVKTV